MNQNILKQLINSGLTDNEARIYLVLLELGRDTVTQISRKAKLNRTTGYDILEKLCLIGLSNRSGKNSKRIYIAEPPIRLKQYFQNQQKMAERKTQTVTSLLPDLRNLYKTDLKPTVKFAEGKEEMEKMALKTLDSKGEIYCISNLENYAERFGEMGKYRSRERQKRKIKEKCLALKNKEALDWWNKVYKNSKAKQKYTKYRWLNPDDRFTTAGEISIFDDTVIGTMSKPEENVAFEVKSQTYADFLKIMFEKAWENSEEIK